MNEVQHPQTHLFMLRLWTEDLGDGKTEWRGKVQHALSGEARYFREWAELIAFVQEQVGDIDHADEVTTK